MYTRIITRQSRYVSTLWWNSPDQSVTFRARLARLAACRGCWTSAKNWGAIYRLWLKLCQDKVGEVGWVSLKKLIHFDWIRFFMVFVVPCYSRSSLFISVRLDLTKVLEFTGAMTNTCCSLGQMHPPHSPCFFGTLKSATWCWPKALLVQTQWWQNDDTACTCKYCSINIYVIYIYIYSVYIYIYTIVHGLHMCIHIHIHISPWYPLSTPVSQICFTAIKVLMHACDRRRRARRKAPPGFWGAVWRWGECLGRDAEIFFWPQVVVNILVNICEYCGNSQERQFPRIRWCFLI